MPEARLQRTREAYPDAECDSCDDAATVQFFGRAWCEECFLVWTQGFVAAALLIGVLNLLLHAAALFVQ